MKMLPWMKAREARLPLTMRVLALEYFTFNEQCNAACTAPSFVIVRESIAIAALRVKVSVLLVSQKFCFCDCMRTFYIVNCGYVIR